jgi:hypothetical protein
MRPSCRLLIAAVLCAAPTGLAVAQVDLDVEQRLVEDLLREGKYKQVSLEAQRIEQSLKAQAAAKNYPLIRWRISLLRCRETVERLMGNLDAAEKLLGDAERLFSDKDFQRWIGVNAPRDNDPERLGSFWLPWSLMYFTLLDDRGLILVDRIRAANQAFEAGASPVSAEKQAQVVKWFRQLDELGRGLIAARQTSLARIPQDRTAAEGRSPAVHMMLGGTRYRLVAGLRQLEASKLPFTLPADAATGVEAGPPRADHPVVETPVERKAAARRQLRRAIESLEKAGEDADAACMEALGRFEKDQEGSKERAVAEAEATRIRADVREPLAEALLLDGQLDKAREVIDAVLVDLRGVEQERHPALARPLILAARVALEETRRSIAAKDVVQAERQAKGAIDALYEAKVLLGVEDSEFDREAPIHAALATLIATSDELVRKSGQLVAAKDAADAAARRALDAIRASEGRRKPQGGNAP